MNILGRCLLCEQRQDHCLLVRREGRLAVLCRGCTNPEDDQWWDEEISEVIEKRLRLADAEPLLKEEEHPYPCPIPGCQKVFHGSHGGWDRHVEVLTMHPGWHTDISDPDARKAQFKAEFPDWFKR